MELHVAEIINILLDVGKQHVRFIIFFNCQGKIKIYISELITYLKIQQFLN